jgi:hypothetical protein
MKIIPTILGEPLLAITIINVCLKLIILSLGSDQLEIGSELTSLPRQCEVPCLDQLQSPAALSSREEMHTNSSRFIFHLEQ